MGQGMSPVALCLVSDPSFLPFVCQTGQRILIWASLTLFLIGRILFVNKRFHLFQRSQEGVTPSMMNIPVVCYLYQYSYLVFCLMFSHKMVAGNIDARFSHESPQSLSLSDRRSRQFHGEGDTNWAKKQTRQRIWTIIE